MARFDRIARVSAREKPLREPIRVTSPSTGELVAEVPDEGADGIRAAFARAGAAAADWAALSVRGRAEAIRRWRDRVLDDALLPALVVRESGKPRHEVDLLEIPYFAHLCGWAAREGPRVLRDEKRPYSLLPLVKRAVVRRRPLGVVGVVGPWNFPLLNNAADAVFPLVAGNPVVLKPSEVTPLTSLRMKALWDEAGNPTDAFQVVTGRGDAGAALVDLADGVMFTGSVATGRRVAARCGERLVPCVAELGGKSAFVVLPGADLDFAARAAAWTAFAHSGQVCVRAERLLVPESTAAAFEAKLVERVRALRTAASAPDRGLTRGTEHDLGAITFARQVEVAERHLQDALALGARNETEGGARGDGSGRFFSPAVLGGATPGMAVAREETFAPLLPILRYRTVDEAVAIANDADFGLAGYVFGPERDARAVARRLDTGLVGVNDGIHVYGSVEAPLGGWKASGLGVRHGPEGLRTWTRTTTIVEDRSVMKPVGRILKGLFYFPYDARALAFIRRYTRLRNRRGWAAKLGPLP